MRMQRTRACRCVVVVGKGRLVFKREGKEGKGKTKEGDKVWGKKAKE